MVEVKYKEVPILELFAWIRGNSKYTKAYCKQYSGVYPVYSANNESPLGYRDRFDFEGETLTVSVNGLAGRTTVIKDKFSINGDRAVLRPLCDGIDLKYAKYVLEPVLRANVKGRMGDNGKNEYTKINEKMVESLNLKINIPILDDGVYDINAQKDLAEKLEALEEKRKDLLEKKTKLQNLIVAPFPSKDYEKKSLKDLFVPINGKSKYTRAYCNRHKGEYEVFTGTTIGSFAFIDSFDYSDPMLTFTTDGEHAGTVQLITNDKYSIGGHRTALLPKVDALNLEYFAYSLQAIIKSKVKRGDVPSVKWSMIKNEEVNVPIGKDGGISKDAQKDLVEKYKKVNQIINNICEKIDSIVTIQPV